MADKLEPVLRRLLEKYGFTPRETILTRGVTPERRSPRFSGRRRPRLFRGS